MASNNKNQSLTPQVTYHYVQGLLKVQDNEDQSQILEEAVGVCFNYLTQKKTQWGIYLQKLMELFLDLAFQTQKHSKIKEVLKSYRTVTQNQHPDSLKTILQYYRDEKLRIIIQDQIPKQNLQFIREMKSFEDEEGSSQVFISSFNPEQNTKKQNIRSNLKIVWQGYKTIVDTVRLNHKMESVYRSTLKKIFEFVQLYNRKHQFKTFCDNQRKYGLRNILNKRGDKTQKNYYIDIEKQQVNTNNIQIRLEQFDLSTKLGLWQQAFQTLQDIKQIMKVRKGPVKNMLKCSYFQRLALIFKKSNYWHYHAFAFYNYYTIYITKSKLSNEDRMRVADKLILSVLCIPPSTLQRYQSKQSQQKIASMMISSNKIPQKNQLEQMMISKGVVENASIAIKQLWYFMFLQFDLTSLQKGLKILDAISKNGDYKEFIQLLQQILIYKQLISVAYVYHRIKYESLLSIIPFPKEKVQKVLLQSHHRKVIDFVLDESQGIIIFQEQSQQTNPYQQFLSCFIDVGLLYQESRHYDRQFIMKKVSDFTNTSEDYYNNVRNYKIQQYKTKLRKPLQDLENKQRQRERKIQEQKRNQELVKKQKQAEQKKQQQQKRRLFIDKNIIIKEIIEKKQSRNVRIGGKKIEHLNEDDIKSIDISIFEQGLQQIKLRVANQNEARNKKRFQKIDYIQRQRRQQINNNLKQFCKNQQKQKEELKRILDFSRSQFEQKQKFKEQIQKIAPQVKVKIDEHYSLNKQKFASNMVAFKQNLTDQFKKKILVKARQLLKADQQKKIADEKRRRDEQINQSSEIQWKRKPKVVESSQTQSNNSSKKIVTNEGAWGRKTVTGITQSNSFSGLKIQEQSNPKKQKWGTGKRNQQKKQQKKQQIKQQRWGSKKIQDNASNQSKPNIFEKKDENSSNKFMASPVTEQAFSKKVQSTREQPELNLKKKQDKKTTKGRGW